jgi:Ca-activated chloride channel homolog
MTLGPIQFAAPWWLLVGLLASASLLLLELRLEGQRRKALATFSSRGAALVSSLSRPLRLFKGGLKVAGVAFICCALARPQWGFRMEETYRRGLDLMFVVDTSKSMLTPDVKPNRLTRAKLAIYDLVSKFEGDRVGLVAFAGDAFLQSPLTLDRNMFEQTLDAIDTDTIPRGGTDIGRGLRVAVEALRSQPANRKLLVMLTDGEDLEAGALAAAREAAAAGVRIYTVGVGTPGGELIPEPGGGFAKDASGAFVHSRLDEKTLAEIAQVTGGQYRPLGADGRGLELLYQDVLAKLPRDTVGERMHRIPLERFEWPLGAAAICLALEALLQERRRRKAAIATTGQARPFRSRRSVATGGLGLAAGLVLALGASGRARASVGDAEKDYRAGQFSKAAAEYQKAGAQHPTDARLQLNLGAATYKSGDYAAAGAALQRALHSDRLDLQQRAYYDLGNSLYRTGQKSVQSEPEQTIEQWKKAIASYEGALKLDPKDADAVYNRDLVKKKLAELQQQKQKKDQQKKDDKKQDQKQSAGGKQDQQKSGQGQKDQQKSGQGLQNAQQSGQGQEDQKKSADGKQGQQKPGQGQPAEPKPGSGQQAEQKPGEGQQPQPQAGQQPQPKPAQGQQGQGQSADKAPAGAAASPQDQAGDQPPEAAPRPGQLSRADAKALLDSLRGDDRLMRAGGPENVKHSEDEPIEKDW